MMCNMENEQQIIVIGGGAAGLAAAIAAAYKARLVGSAVHVRILERDDRVGRSILVTGNGRCNFTNAHIDADVYHNAAFVRTALDELDEIVPWRAQTHHHSVCAFFEALGLAWREEAEGRRYPVTGKASTVLSVLRRAAQSLGVEECCNAQVCSIDPPRAGSDHFTLRMKDGSFERAGVVILACGASAAQSLAEQLEFVPQTPVLGPLKTNTEHIRSLDNIRVRCGLSVQRNGETIAHEQGELLFRKYGVSGIAVFNLSRFACTGDQLVIDFLPHYENAFSLLSERVRTLEALFDRTPTLEETLGGLVLPLLAEELIKRAGLQGSSLASKQALRTLAGLLKQFSLEVQGIGDVKQCQVSRGGFAVAQIDARTQEVKGIPHLYIVGEAQDVDAPCGGYNLHWAWASGLLAGLHSL